MTFVSPLGPLEQVWGNQGGKDCREAVIQDSCRHLLVSPGSVGMLVRNDSGMPQGCSSSLARQTQTWQHIRMEKSMGFRVRLTWLGILKTPSISLGPLIKWFLPDKPQLHYLKNGNNKVCLSHTDIRLQWGCAFTKQIERSWQRLCIQKI